jgi:2'-5' RNA ligase
MKNSTMYEYLLVIPPSDSVFSDTRNLKIQCKTEYGWDAPAKSTPHITLAKLIQPLCIEDKLVNKYKRIAASISPFEVHLSGFVKFTGTSNTIYINVRNGNQISEIVKEIRKLSKPMLKKIKNYSPVYSLIPHLTIAKGISESSFKEAWPNWQSKSYDASSFTSGMLLLKREISATLKKYESVGFFPFHGLGPMDRQLMLFDDIS